MSITIAVRSEQFGDTQLTSDHFNTSISYASFTVDSALGNLNTNNQNGNSVANIDDLSALENAITSDLTALLTSLGAAFGASGTDPDFVWIAPSFASTLGGASNGDLSTTLLNIDGVLKDIETNVASNLAEIQANDIEIANLQSALNSEITARTNADAALQSALNTEILDRTAADAGLSSDISTLRGDVNGTLGLTVTAAGFDGTVDFSTTNYLNVATVTTIKEALMALDGSLDNSDGRIDAILTSLGFDDGSGNLGTQYNPSNSNYILGNTVVADIDLLDASLANVYMTLNTAINAEAAQRTQADNTLQSNIDAEESARQLADTNLQNNIDAEAVTRANADTQLGNQLAALQSELDLTQTNIGTDAGGVYTSTAGNTHAKTDNIKTDLDALDAGIVANAQSISNLGSAFEYVDATSVDPQGVASSPSTDPLATTAVRNNWVSGVEYQDLSGLTQKATGDYYKVATSGWVSYSGNNADAIFVHANDGLVWNASNTLDVIDNTNSDVAVTGSLTITGSADAGFNISSATIDGQIAQLNLDLTAETNARTAADTLLQSNLDAETAARIAEDTNLANLLATETTDRQNEDANLQAQITQNDGDILQLINDLAAEANARQTEDQNLQNAINAEATARATADIGLQAQITSNDSDISDLDTELTATQASVGVNPDGSLPAYANTNNFQTGDTHHVAIEKLDAALQVAQTVSPSRLTIAPVTSQYASYDRLADPNDLQAYSSSKFGAVGSSAIPYSGHGVGTADLHDYEVAEESVVLGAFVHDGAPTKSHNDNQSHLANFSYWYNVAVFKNGIRLFQRQSNAATLTSSDEYQIKTNDYPATYPAGNWSNDLRYALLIPKYIESTYRYETFKATLNPDTGANYTYGDLDPVYHANASTIMANLVDNPDQNPVRHPLAGMKNLDNAGQPVHASIAGNPHPQNGEVRYWIVRFGAALDPQDIITVDYMGLR